MKCEYTTQRQRHTCSCRVQYDRDETDRYQPSVHVTSEVTSVTQSTAPSISLYLTDQH